jgi:hypothetical protein
LAARRKGQPAWVIAIADKAQQRLCRRFRRLLAEHKPSPKVVVAVARELSGFVWAALQRPTTA